jgi:hypothetical protein
MHWGVGLSFCARHFSGISTVTLQYRQVYADQLAVMGSSMFFLSRAAVEGGHGAEGYAVSVEGGLGGGGWAGVCCGAGGAGLGAGGGTRYDGGAF